MLIIYQLSSMKCSCCQEKIDSLLCSQILEAEDYHELDGRGLDVLSLLLEVECELPNANLHAFHGRVRIRHHNDDPGRFAPITMNQMLLRGCMLKNSRAIYGLVVYAGRESRIQMNSVAPPLKVGAFDHFLNMQVATLITAQLALCVFCAGMSYNWRETEVCSGGFGGCNV
jgi:hypothetical protein